MLSPGWGLSASYSLRGAVVPSFPCEGGVVWFAQLACGGSCVLLTVGVVWGCRVYLNPPPRRRCPHRAVLCVFRDGSERVGAHCHCHPSLLSPLSSPPPNVTSQRNAQIWAVIPAPRLQKLPWSQTGISTQLQMLTLMEGVPHKRKAGTSTSITGDMSSDRVSSCPHLPPLAVQPGDGLTCPSC